MPVIASAAYIDCYVSGIIYLGVRSYGFACRVGSIRAVVDGEGKEVFEAKYDAWGVQEVTLNAIGLRRGYTGHEMLSEYGIINMNGRLYDPMLGRFFSPDSFVQFPGFTQSYNRYSYCLNNPLKFSDPSGQISIAAVFSIFNVFSSMLQAAINGENVWKAGVLSALRAGATYGIGSAFGAIGSVGHELLRAGAHGVAGGIFSALSGGSFGSGFAAGAISSAAGSLAQGFKMNTMQMILTSTAAGGIAAWASGGNFLSGAMQGLCVGLLNHAEHDGGAESTVNETPEDTIEVVPNLEWENSTTGHFRTPVVCTASASGYADARFNLAMASTMVSSIGIYGKSLEKFSQNTTIGENGMFYYAKKTERPFYGNQYIRTKKAAPIGKNIKIISNKVGNKLGILQVGLGLAQDYQTYQNTGTFELYHAGRAGASWAGGWAAAEVALSIGGLAGTAIGGPAGGIILGTIFGIGGALGGSAFVEKIYDYYWFK